MRRRLVWLSSLWFGTSFRELASGFEVKLTSSVQTYRRGRVVSRVVVGGSSENAEDSGRFSTKLFASPTTSPRAPINTRQRMKREGVLSDELDHVLTLPLLTAEEEIVLGRRVQLLLEIEAAQRKAKKTNTLIVKLQKNYTSTQLVRAVREGREARDTMILSNMRLVLSLASRAYRQSSPPMTNGVGRDGQSTTLGDLVAEGVVGLATAVDRWDPERGFRFATYATFWIRQAVRRSYQRSGIIVIPPNVQELAQKARASAQQLERKLGRPPTSDEYAAQVGLTRKQIAMTKRVIHSVVSIDLPASGRVRAGHEEGAEPFLALKFQADDPSPDVAAAFSELRHILDDTMASKLLPSERDVLRLRLGLDDGASRSRTEVSLISGISLDRVRRLETSAIRKLRKHKSRLQGLESLCANDLV